MHTVYTNVLDAHLLLIKLDEVKLPDANSINETKTHPPSGIGNTWSTMSTGWYKQIMQDTDSNLLIDIGDTCWYQPGHV